MKTTLIQLAGIACTLLYAGFIVWVYATEPRTLQEVARGAQVAAGTYDVDPSRFAAALALFRREQFRAARGEWQRADPARRDPRTQFYIAYSFYREGWGRFYHDDVLYRQGLEAVNRALELSPGRVMRVDDPGLGLRTAAELEAELEQGLERTLSDLNPLKVLRERQ